MSMKSENSDTLKGYVDGKDTLKPSVRKIVDCQHDMEPDTSLTSMRCEKCHEDANVIEYLCKLREENKRLKTQTGIDMVEEQLRIAKRKLQIAIEALEAIKTRQFCTPVSQEYPGPKQIARKALEKLK